MEDLSKINAATLYLLLKNLIIGLMTICIAMVGCNILPPYLSPIVSLACIGYLYYQIILARTGHNDACMLTTYAIFVSLISFTVTTVMLNIGYAVIPEVELAHEFIIFNKPFIPSLIMMPLCTIVFGIIYLRIEKPAICKACNRVHGTSVERGRLGIILNYESRFQLKNLFLLFLAISIVIWTYYIFEYVKVNQNSRDWYVFLWLVIIGIFIDELYFIARYYNLYLDLRERGHILSLEDLTANSDKTFVRVYLICDNYVYVRDNASSKIYETDNHIDTPFLMQFDHNNVTNAEVEEILKDKYAISGGELRLFYTRVYSEYMGLDMNRYFYFLEGSPEDYPALEGKHSEWIKVKDIRTTFDRNPKAFKRMFLADITRLSTIMITSKSFYEDGQRKSRLRHYRPTFSFNEVRKSDIDFNDDKWIKLSTNNSDTIRWRINKIKERLRKFLFGIKADA